MRGSYPNPLRVLQEVASNIEHRAKLSSILRHRVDGDDCIIFMFSGWFTSQGHAPSCWSFLAMINYEPSNEEGLRVHREVGHSFVVGVVVGDVNVARVSLFFCSWRRSRRCVGKILFLWKGRRIDRRGVTVVSGILFTAAS